MLSNNVSAQSKHVTEVVMVMCCAIHICSGSPSLPLSPMNETHTLIGSVKLCQSPPGPPVIFFYTQGEL